jgi:hypothetical protein
LNTSLKITEGIQEALQKKDSTQQYHHVRILKTLFKNWEVLNQLRAGVAIGDQWARDRLSRVYKEMTQNVAGQVRDGMKHGLIREVDPDLLGFFNVILDEIAMHRASLDDRYTINQVMAFVADMLYHAFLTEKGKKVLGAFNRVPA